ncbi:hypothetical protein TNCT_537221 [Trichonephila clavata]|uniref:Uncharacterized protein n=1 Tax=Trichonephila clavata TaxID=2740835 RepID=A0A8X6L1U9_TRICU|nr:hypothetical protein TNCT_537221 [Trichonephila clavata]
MYPEPDWVHIYTDGGLLKDSESTRARVYCLFFFFYLNSGNFTSAFDCGVAALQVVLAQWHCHPNGFTRAAVFCDSKASIFPLNSNSTPASSNIHSCL